jgi:hypothetical protein
VPSSASTGEKTVVSASAASSSRSPPPGAVACTDVPPRVCTTSVPSGDQLGMAAAGPVPGSSVRSPVAVS